MNNIPGAARALVDHIDLLKRQIRSGVTPTIGDTEELFALGEQLDFELKTSDPSLPCSLKSCKRAATERIGDQPYCTRCAKALRMVTTAVQSAAPATARERVEAMLQGHAPWPVEAGPRSADERELRELVPA